MKVLIAGAGIGGLTTALCLARSDHEVIIVERLDKLSERGAGIQCGANALRVLDYLGVLSNLERRASSPVIAQALDAVSGRVLSQNLLGDDYRATYGYSYLTVSRQHLQACLLDAVECNENIQIQLDWQLKSVRESADKIEIVSTKQDTAVGDLLVGADGIRSKVRNSILARVGANPSSYSAWRLSVSREMLSIDFPVDRVLNLVGFKQHAVIYPMDNGKKINLVAVVNASTGAEAGWLSEAPWVELEKDFSGWHHWLTHLIQAAKEQQCFRWSLRSVERLPYWHRSRTGLIGDAAHAALPFAASGAAMAIEDARIFQRCLDLETIQSDDRDRIIEPTWRRFYQARISRTAQLQRMSSYAGQLYHLPSRRLRQAAFAALTPAIKRRERFLSSYDANTVPI